jgi:hypothetical protein
MVETVLEKVDDFLVGDVNYRSTLVEETSVTSTTVARLSMTFLSVTSTTVASRLLPA